MIIAILGGEFSAFLPGTFQNVFMSKWWGPPSLPPRALPDLKCSLTLPLQERWHTRATIDHLLTAPVKCEFQKMMWRSSELKACNPLHGLNLF